MRYLLDTDQISFLQRRSGTEFLALAAHIAQHQSTDFGFSIVSFHEQVIGAHTFITRSQTPSNVVRGYTLANGNHSGVFSSTNFTIRCWSSSYI